MPIGQFFNDHLKTKSSHHAQFFIIVSTRGCHPNNCQCHQWEPSLPELEQLERLRSEDTPRRLMITHTIECVESQVKTRSNDLEDIGQGQRSSHATHLLMLVIICIKYGKNPSRTIDATERTRFSKSRPNDLENIGQGQRSLHATHPLILMMICAKYGKNSSI